MSFFVMLNVNDFNVSVWLVICKVINVLDVRVMYFRWKKLEEFFNLVMKIFVWIFCLICV